MLCDFYHTVLELLQEFISLHYILEHIIVFGKFLELLIHSSKDFVWHNAILFRRSFFLFRVLFGFILRQWKFLISRNWVAFTYFSDSLFVFSLVFCAYFIDEGKCWLLKLLHGWILWVVLRFERLICDMLFEIFLIIGHVKVFLILWSPGFAVDLLLNYQRLCFIIWIEFLDWDTTLCLVGFDCILEVVNDFFAFVWILLFCSTRGLVAMLKRYQRQWLFFFWRLLINRQDDFQVWFYLVWIGIGLLFDFWLLFQTLLSD